MNNTEKIIERWFRQNISDGRIDGDVEELKDEIHKCFEEAQKQALEENQKDSLYKRGFKEGFGIGRKQTAEEILKIISEIIKTNELPKRYRRTEQNIGWYNCLEQIKKDFNSAYLEKYLGENHSPQTTKSSQTGSSESSVVDTRKGCGQKLDALGYVLCGDEVKENSIPQGEYFLCPSCSGEKA